MYETYINELMESGFTEQMAKALVKVLVDIRACELREIADLEGAVLLNDGLVQS